MVDISPTSLQGLAIKSLYTKLYGKNFSPEGDAKLTVHWVISTELVKLMVFMK